MPRQYVYVTCFGTLYRLSKTAAKKYKALRMAGYDTDLDDFGTKLTTHCINVTDYVEEMPD